MGRSESASEVPLVVDDGLDLLGRQQLAEAGHATRPLTLLAVLLALLGPGLDKRDVVGLVRELPHRGATREVGAHGAASRHLRVAVRPALGVAARAAIGAALDVEVE